MKKMTQSEMLEIMLSEGWVSPMDALREAGCMRLGARVYEWKAAGRQVLERWAEGPGRFGKARWKEFRFSPKKPEQAELF
jgi:hypothetical protein